ncbi:MAG: folate-binding protein [Rubrivivax sp.]
MTSSTLPRGVLRLADWGLIRAHGPDVRSFLHGQLTQDVQGLQPGQAKLAGYCSPKGRLLASFVIWAGMADEVFLACSADLLAATLKRLSMFVLRAKCKLEDVSAQQFAWGAAGDDALNLLGSLAPWQLREDEGRIAIRLPDAQLDGQPVPRALLLQPAAAPALPGPALDAQAWAALEALSGVPRIVAATSEQFVPQMVNLELVGGVNFQKGCYPGQEVVARSQYRGTLKRRGFVVSGAAAMQPGQDVFHSADPEQPAGLVALAGRLAPDRHVALAELKLAALDGGSLHLGTADGPPLTLGSLPYAVPLDAA